MHSLITRKRLAAASVISICILLMALASGEVGRASGIDSIFTSTAPQTYFGPLFTRADGYVDPATKVSDAVREDTSKGKKAEVVILLADQADVSAAYDIKDEDERGWFVYNTLTTHAAVTQSGSSVFSDGRGREVSIVLGGEHAGCDGRCLARRSACGKVGCGTGRFEPADALDRGT
ncbi:MAG: hypothetical protein IPO41_13825 [Acidobacteria bacterium]|nr:hypothetical protein [Acidobacteriota bacterium]